MRAKKVDANHNDIVAALKKLGCRIQSLAAIGDGCPDLLVGVSSVSGRRLVVLEVKDGTRIPSERKLTPAEEAWHRLWDGFPVHVVESVEQAVGVVCDAARQP